MYLRSFFIKNSCVRWYKCSTKTNNTLITPYWRHNLFSTTPYKSVRRKLRSDKNVQTLEPQIEGLVVETGNLEVSRLWKPFLFTIGFSTASFTFAAIWQYENIRTKGQMAFYSTSRWIQERTKKFGKWRNDVNKWWTKLTESQRLFFGLCLANVLVFFAWRVPKFQPTMVKYFCSNPAGRALCWPMVLCTFSHYSGLHLFTNMYVLHSFSTGTIMSMGKEQFLGFYMAAGVISSFVSILHRLIANRPGLSLGASGAIMAVLGYMCTRYPDQELHVIFLPFYTFKAASAIKVIMGIDIVGVLLGWRFIDHAAHLGGAMFGIFWSYWGSYYIWQKREPLLEVWHSIRGPPQK